MIGNVNCELREVFTKLAKLQAKQNFAFAIIAGDLFGDCTSEKELDEVTGLLHENIVVPLPTYFTLGSRPLPTRVVEKIEAKDEVCSNLYFLGKRGSLKTAEGIRLVALGGTLDSDGKASNRFDATYAESDAKALYGAKDTDILITHQWPKSIRDGSKVALPDTTTPTETQCIADLCSTLKPRYHISTSDTFYEREPFFHLPDEDSPDTKPITRFLSLASYIKSSKQKWMYAFTLDPKATAPLTIPAGTTASPLSTTQSTKRKNLPSQQESYRRFAVDDDTHDHRPRKRARGPPPGPEQCFFCLSNPNLATHLITSIGDESYLTTAKGPLPSAQTFPELGFPGHMLIIPFTHTPSLNTVTDREARVSTYTEMQRYRHALQDMLHHRAKEDALGAVTFEISRANGIHVHWQFVPVAAETVQRGLVEAAFKVEAENLQYPKFEEPSEDPSSEPGDFFRVWIAAPAPQSGDTQNQDSTQGQGGDNPPEDTTHDTIQGEDNDPTQGEDKDNQTQRKNKWTDKSLILPLSADFRFDLQFGRRVLAKLMGLEKRIHWKNAVQTVADEEADASAFKEAFKAFDFSLG